MPPRSAAPRPGPWSILLRYRGSVVLGIVCLLGTNAMAMAIPWVLKAGIESLQLDARRAPLATYAALMIGLAIGQGAIRIGSRLLLFNAARRAEYDLRNALFGHLLTLAPSYFRRSSIGDVMSRLTVDVPTVRALWGPGLLNLVNTVMVFVTAIVLMVSLSPSLTLFALLPYPLLILAGQAFGRRFFRLSREVQNQMGRMSGSVQEDLVGIGFIKSYALEPARGEKFRRESEEYLEKSMQVTRMRGRLLPILGAIGSAGTIIVLWVGGEKVISGELSLGALVAFMAYLALLTWPTLAIGWLLSLFQRGMAAWSRLQEIFAEEPSITDGPGPAVARSDVRGDIELRNLTLSIDGDTILDGVSLKVPAGSVCAVVGRTGSGKSTLVEAIPRLLEVPQDRVFLDGRDVTDWPLRSLRGAVGYAPQEAFLFSATIADNIDFGRPPQPEETTEEKRAAVARAASLAGLDRDLAAFPDGLDTLVGERGITLSGGQRQRVALARALASGAPILILDDSLSSVDAQTERDILEGILKTTRAEARRTAILISHRVAAVSWADQIAVVDEGKVVEVGTHRELVERGGVYSELYAEQLADEALVEAAS